MKYIELILLIKFQIINVIENKIDSLKEKPDELENYLNIIYNTCFSKKQNQ
jgi:hypothetical protein